jgi:hypothetical protein
VFALSRTLNLSRDRSRRTIQRRCAPVASTIVAAAARRRPRVDQEIDPIA